MSSSQTLSPPQGPEYTPCGCSHIEPEHRPDAGACLTCDCGAYRPAPAVPAGQAPATDQTALRDRIGAEMARADGWDWAGAVFSTLDTPGANRYRKLADAVLAVLPASVDRAAVLRDFLWRLEQSAGDAAAEKFLDDNPELRRMADETPTAAASAVVVRRATDETPGEAQLPFIHVDDDGDQLDIGAVMASTYDGEAPVVYVAAEQHQGDTLATVYVRPERVDAVIAALRSARLAAETLPAADQQQPKEA